VTFGEKRAAIRSLRSVVSQMREKQRPLRVSSREWRDLSLTVPREDYERAEWAMARVKVWIDDEQRFMRQNCLFVQTGLAREHFVVKGCPVFYE
jgi:hypothetical protein